MLMSYKTFQEAFNKALLRPWLVYTAFWLLVAYIAVYSFAFPAVNVGLAHWYVHVGYKLKDLPAQFFLPTEINGYILTAFLTPIVNWITSRGFEKGPGSEK